MLYNTKGDRSVNSANKEVELQPLIKSGEDGLVKSRIGEDRVYFDQILWKLVTEYADKNNVSETNALRYIVRQGLKQESIEILDQQEAQQQCKVISKWAIRHSKKHHG